MERITFKPNITPQTKAPQYRFQETCLNLAKISGLNKGVLFGLWKRIGPEIFKIEAEIKAGEIKNPKAYILYKMKK